MKEALCRAFCDALDCRKVPCGYALTTPFEFADGDPVLLYLIENAGRWQIVDDGTQVALVEASGADLASGTRAEAFNALLDAHGASWDALERSLRIGPLNQDDVPAAALKFIALLLRLQDLALLSRRQVRSTFRDNAIAAIHERFDGMASVQENSFISGHLRAYRADVVIKIDQAPPVGVYLGTTNEQALKALVVKMEAEKYQDIACRVVLLLERAKENPLQEATYALAQSRLDEVLSFRGVEDDSMRALQRLLAQPALLQ